MKNGGNERLAGGRGASGRSQGFLGSGRGVLSVAEGILQSQGLLFLISCWAPVEGLWKGGVCGEKGYRKRLFTLSSPLETGDLLKVTSLPSLL